MSWRLLDFIVLDEEGNPTGETFEELVQHDVTELVSSTGRRAVRRNFQRFAHTPTRWGDTNAYYDRDLKAVVRGAHDVDKLCRERGLTPIADLPAGTRERCNQRQLDHYEHYKKVDERWEALAEKHGMYREDGSIDAAAAGRVWEEHAPAQTILNGTSDILPQLTDF